MPAQMARRIAGCSTGRKQRRRAGSPQLPPLHAARRRRRTVLHHQRQELDHHLGGGAQQHLLLAALLGIVHSFLRAGGASSSGWLVGAAGGGVQAAARGGGTALQQRVGCPCEPPDCAVSRRQALLAGLFAGLIVAHRLRGRDSGLPLERAPRRRQWWGQGSWRAAPGPRHLHVQPRRLPLLGVAAATAARHAAAPGTARAPPRHPGDSMGCGICQEAHAGPPGRQAAAAGGRAAQHADWASSAPPPPAASATRPL